MTVLRAVHNFNAGPSVLPLEALEEVHRDFFNFAGTGMSILEVSHRSPEFEAMHNETQDLLRELMAIPANYKVLFLQGGAALQFDMIPMNLLGAGTADYVITGVWAQKAHDEARKFGKVRVAASSAATGHDRIPALSELHFARDASYVHITTNNTIYGTAWHEIPDTGNVPLIADMSSDILSAPVEVSRFGLIYAGAQKNIGPAGVTVVIIRDDLLARSKADLPTMLSYRTHAENNSLYNTAPTFSIYVMNKVLHWIKRTGGATAMAKLNRAKADAVYAAIDRNSSFYKGHAQIRDRSLMNATFRLPTPELEKLFLAEAQARKMIGIRGHRLAGGCRASLYNSLPMESALALASFMDEFAKLHH